MARRRATESDRPPLQSKWAIVLACLLTVLLIAAPTSLANGHGIKVFLGYVPGISNWGAFEANGLATVNAGDGQVHLVVNHLPHDPHVQYQAWVVPADEPTTMIALGTFVVDGAGHAEVDFTRGDLHTREYRFFVITAEPVPDKDQAPDGRRALAGVFPNSQALPLPDQSKAFADLLGDESATSATPKGPGSARTDPQGGDSSPPLTLPITGTGLPTRSAWEMTALAGGLLAATLFHVISKSHQMGHTGGQR